MIDQPIVVSRMQTNRRLVQDVKHTDQPGTDLACQSNSLTFAARKRRCRSIQRQVIQTDIQQESQPIADFFQRFGRDELTRFIELQIRKKIRQHRQSTTGRPAATEGLAWLLKFGLPDRSRKCRACGFSRAPCTRAMRLRPCTLPVLGSWDALLSCRYFSIQFGDDTASNVPPYFIGELPPRQV